MEGRPSSPLTLDRGIHVLHLFCKVDRLAWSRLAPGESERALGRLNELCTAWANPSHPRLNSYVNLGGKADLAFLFFAENAAELGRMHRAVETCFPPGTVQRVFSYLSVTELTEYMSSEEDTRVMLEQQEKLIPNSPEFNERLQKLNQKRAEYEHYRLYPEMPDWEIMCFYPMNKRRAGPDNWYLLDFPVRRKLMGGHARVGRTFAGRVSQLITGSSGLDDWEWGVTLIAHQLDAIKEIVYEMRFDEVSARFGEFGPFYTNLRLSPEAAWEHLRLSPE